MTLNNKQQVFVSEYLKCWNASEAARRAGYNGQANIVGPRLLSNVIIAEEIKQRLAEIKMSADEVLTRLADMARADISDFVTFVDDIKLPFIDLKKAKDAGKLHLVKKIKYNAQGAIEFELHDPIPSLLNIGKAHGLFNNDAGSSDDKPFIIKVMYGDRNQRANNPPTPATPETNPGD